MPSWLNLEARRVVVAGAGGIGTALTIALVEQGSSVMVVDINAGELNSLVKRAEHGIGSVTSMCVDLSTAESCRQVISEAADRLGGIDIMFHVLGINDRRPVLETTDTVWDRILGINLSTAFWLGQAAGSLMVANKYGRIIYFSSVSGLLAHKEHSAYAASKGGLNQLMRVMAHEWAADGVTVNAIAPGYIQTSLTAAYLARSGVRASLESLVPMGRLGEPRDVVGPAMFLASDHASFVTGQVLYVDGGRTLI